MAQWEGALATLERVPQPRRDAEYHALAAALAQRAGKAEVSVMQYQAALATGAPRAAWLTGLAAALEQLGRRAEAVAAYRQALELHESAGAASDFARQRLAELEP